MRLAAGGTTSRRAPGRGPPSMPGCPRRGPTGTGCRASAPTAADASRRPGGRCAGGRSGRRRGSLSQARSPARPSGREPRRRAAWRRDGDDGSSTMAITRMAICGRGVEQLGEGRDAASPSAAISTSATSGRRVRSAVSVWLSAARRGNDRDPRFGCERSRWRAPADRGVRIGHEHARSTGAPPRSVEVGITRARPAPFSRPSRPWSSAYRTSSARVERRSFCWMCARCDSTVRIER